ncbi:MAG: PEP-CTERM sorting domain-containing protein [Planctomycetota bacterium]
MPFTEDFDDGVANGFSASGAYTANGVDGTYDMSISGAGLVRNSTVDLTNADGAPGITMSTDAEFSTFNGSVGFAAYGTNSGVSTGAFYLLDITGLGTTADTGIRILEISGDGGISVAADLPGSFNFVETDPFSLSASFVPGAAPGSIDIELTLTQGSDSFSISGTDATGLTGDAFGYRTRTTTGGNGELVGSFDNFSVTAIPEPGSLALATAGAVLIVMRRRRS